MKHKTIRNHKDFITTHTDIVVRTHSFYLKLKQPSVEGQSRYGIMVTKRVFKKAVDRNKAKRKIRDWIAFNEDLFLPDRDYIFSLTGGILDYPRDLGRKDVETAMKKAKRLYLEQQKAKDFNKIGN